MAEINSFSKFLNLNEGKREEAKMNELLDLMKRRKLTQDESDLLKSLSRGESLPEEDNTPPTLKTHKTGGGYLFDDEGNVMTEEEGEAKPGQEFTTAKGKTRSVDKIQPPEELIDARVYKNKASEERFIYSYVTLTDEKGVTSHDWIIYRTGGGDFGSLMNTNAEKFKYYKQVTPEVLWKELDHRFDYCMVLDQDLYEDFVNFIELYRENSKVNKDVLTRLYKRFSCLL